MRRNILFIGDIPFGATKLPEFALETDSKCNSNVMLLKEIKPITMTVTPGYPRMSRKRFIRNLKGSGCSKKEAMWLAWYCHSKKIPYGKADSLISMGIGIAQD